MINVTLKDGSVIQVEKGSTLLDVAAKISEGFARKVLSATVDGEVHGLPLPLKHDCAVSFHTFKAHRKWPVSAQRSPMYRPF